MIITIRNQATGEDRAQLMALLCHITGSQRPIATTQIDASEVIALDSTILDTHTSMLISQQRAVEHVLPLKTTYQLVSRAFKAESSSIVVGEAHACTPVCIGGAGTAPVIIAGPCAVENREQLLRSEEHTSELQSRQYL